MKSDEFYGARTARGTINALRQLGSVNGDRIVIVYVPQSGYADNLSTSNQYRRREDAVRAASSTAWIDGLISQYEAISSDTRSSFVRMLESNWCTAATDVTSSAVTFDEVCTRVLPEVAPFSDLWPAHDEDSDFIPLKKLTAIKGKLLPIRKMGLLPEDE